MWILIYSLHVINPRLIALQKVQSCLIIDSKNVEKVINAVCELIGSCSGCLTCVFAFSLTI